MQTHFAPAADLFLHNAPGVSVADQAVSWCIVANDDQTRPPGPGAGLGQAGWAPATYDIDSSHVPMLSRTHGDFVLDVIRAAAARAFEPASHHGPPAPRAGGSRAQKERGHKRRSRWHPNKCLTPAVRRHAALASERPFQVVLVDICAGISQPDIKALFARLAASTSVEEFTALVRQAQGSVGLFRFWHLDDADVLALDPQARRRAGRRLVRLIMRATRSPWGR